MMCVEDLGVGEAKISRQISRQSIPTNSAHWQRIFEHLALQHNYSKDSVQDGCNASKYELP